MTTVDATRVLMIPHDRKPVELRARGITVRPEDTDR
jgi:hypothetical protein